MHVHHENSPARRLFQKYLPVFNALGDPVRQQIMFLLADGAHRSVMELAAEVKLSRPTISHHLKILAEAGLVGVRREGVRSYYFPNFDQPLKMSHEFSQILGNITTQKRAP